MDRKSFVKKVAVGTLGVTLLGAGCNTSSEGPTLNVPNINSNKQYKWKMVTTWPPNFPVVGEVANAFAQWVSTMSGGRMEINVYGAGELIPALEVFEAVSSGAAEMGSGASYYWSGRDASLPFFTSVPFGMNAQQMNAWLYGGGGLALWESLYERFNLVPRPAGNTGVQMAGWFNKEINTIDDFKGLKMRMPGLGAKVLQLAGGTSVLSSGSEIYTNLERGVIDATEWIGPYHDYLMGFHKIAKYYYAPGWHETGSNLEFIYNKRAYDNLPSDLKMILDTACYRANMWVLSEFEARNNEYLQRIRQDSEVSIRTFSAEVIDGLYAYTQEMLNDLTAKDENCKKVYTAYDIFRKGVQSWAKYSEEPYHRLISKS
jgi:TRAP-type mannitol/chloroaromatic compound transport system substrate-binding protein